ncbi:MAG: hypothetical protein FWE44_06765 [Defluviitaleaceae bacterium]|nr:hypothetical protein [Defluviitaleaceae bacterium]
MGKNKFIKKVMKNQKARNSKHKTLIGLLVAVVIAVIAGIIASRGADSSSDDDFL